MANSPHVKINLIGKQKLSVTQDFIRWGAQIGKFIIVGTELIALAALLYRFSVDRKIVDLHDQINTEQQLVEAQKPKEDIYRGIQARLEDVKKIQTQTKAKLDIMNSVIAAISTGDFSSTNLSVDLNSIEVDGTAYSIFPINAFINDLKVNPNVTSISLDNVLSSNQGVSFKINIGIKGDTNTP